MKYSLKVGFMIVAILALNTSSVFSQFSFGLKGGFSAVNVLVKDKKEGFDYSSYYKWKPSYHIGFKADYSLSKRSFIIGEFIFSDKGSNVNNDNLHLYYIHIPIMYRFEVGNKISVEIGSDFGILLSSKYKYPVEDEYRKTDLGIGAGAAYNITDELSVSIRFTRSISSVLRKDFGVTFYSGDGFYMGSFNLYENGIRYYNQSVQLSMNYRLKKI